MRRIGWAFVLAVLLAGCAGGAATRPAGADMQGDAARPALSSTWIRSELYFGMDDGDPAEVEARWRGFLDTAVTPRFPDGLSVFDANGQWLYRGDATPIRQRSKVLVILHEDSAARRADIEAIRLAWKQATGHQSVLWVQQSATVSF